MSSDSIRFSSRDDAMISAKGKVLSVWHVRYAETNKECYYVGVSPPINVMRDVQRGKKHAVRIWYPTGAPS